MALLLNILDEDGNSIQEHEHPVAIAIKRKKNLLK